MHNVLIGGESWICNYDPETSPQPKKARISNSRIKPLFIIFFLIVMELSKKNSYRGVGYWIEYFITRSLNVAEKHFTCESWILHHNNAPNHISSSVQKFLAEKNILVLSRRLQTWLHAIIFFFQSLSKSWKVTITSKHPKSHNAASKQSEGTRLPEFLPNSLETMCIFQRSMLWKRQC